MRLAVYFVATALIAAIGLILATQGNRPNLGVLPTWLLTASKSIGIRLDDPAIDLCEDSILKLMRSPSTYRRIDSFISSDPSIPYVLLTFDSKNGFGAEIRDKAACNFSVEKPPEDTPEWRRQFPQPFKLVSINIGDKKINVSDSLILFPGLISQSETRLGRSGRK